MSMELKMDLIDRYNIQLQGLWYEWYIKGQLKIYRVNNTPFLILYNKNWSFKANDIIKIKWIENNELYGQIILLNIGKINQNISVKKGLEKILSEKIKEINSYSNDELEWTSFKSSRINQMTAISCFTNGIIENYMGLKLIGRITIIGLSYDRNIIVIIISGAYSAKKPYGNREGILKECVFPIMKLESSTEKPIVKTSLVGDSSQSSIKSDKGEKVDKKITSLNFLYKRISNLDKKIDKINDYVMSLNSKLEKLANDIYKRFSDIDESFLHLNKQLDAIRSDYLLFSTETISKILVEEDKEEK